jgi:hypothetical protein
MEKGREEEQVPKGQEVGETEVLKSVNQKSGNRTAGALLNAVSLQYPGNTSESITDNHNGAALLRS